MPRVPRCRARSAWLALVAALACWSGARAASAQGSQLLSPGPLSKPHAQLEGLNNCARCHEPGRQVTAARCLACHRPIAERIAARRGVHRDVTNECVQCHSEHNGREGELRPFSTGGFNHAVETGFPLDGRHARIAGNCARCHKGRSFLQASPACASCHADAHRGALGLDCARCHSTSAAFTDARRGFDHARTRFPLVGAHRSVDCARCHANKVFAGLRFGSCTDCHKNPHRQLAARDCTACHNNDTWRTRKVDHSRTAFPLRGRHELVPCASCHKASPVQVQVRFARCADCHADVHRGQFKEDCSSCHDVNGFRAVPFDHAARTRFPLTGRHAGLPCSRCHPNARTLRAGDAAPSPGTGRPRTASPAGSLSDRAAAASPSPAVVFSGASAACTSCHSDPHRGGTSADCSTCHTTSDFRVGTYRHAATLAPFFAGSHAAAACGDCHGRTGVTAAAGAARAPVGTWRFTNLGTACATCHADPHQGKLGAACETCHAIDAPRFAATRFSHASTRFPLTGKHQGVECVRCHKPEAPGAKTFKAAGTTCSSCHSDVHLGQLGTTCERCHGVESFRVAAFRHEAKSLANFFAGTHATLTCRACHKPEQGAFPAGAGTAVRYSGAGSACASCHASDDTHRGALGSQCETCHDPAGWKSASRAFHKAGLFPLEGRHLAVPCASCHANGVMKGTPTTCFDCHWARRQDDRYHTRLGTQCEQCHRPTSWTAVRFDHAASTGFALNLAHQLLRCDNCHRDGRFVGANRECYACHQAAFAATTQPNHVAAGFPTTCEVCHRASQSSWRQATFDHRTFFPLVGVHAAQTCAACHRNNVYTGTPRECVGCHRDDYQRTLAPNHAAAGFPATCEACHRASDASWKGAGFDHGTFPLQGAHATQACSACHRNNVYAGTPRACVGCHQTDYQRTQNPNHVAAGFPTACETCHSFSALSWSVSFDHNRYFPLLGRHAQQACTACHRNNVYRGTPTDCVACHQADYQGTRNPNHVAAGFPTACQQCHKASDTSWQQAVFNHSWFPITSGPHAGRPCSACHTSPDNYKVFSCTTCHGRSETDSHHQGVAGYRYDSLACYACHPAGRH